MEGFILFGAFLTVFFLVLSIYSLLFSPRIDTLSRMEKITNDQDYEEYSEDAKKDRREQLSAILAQLGKFMPNRAYSEKTRVKLSQSAVLMKPEEFTGLCFMCSILFGGILFLLLRSAFAFLFMPIGFVLPGIFLGMKKTARMAKINGQLPEALNIIANGLRAGFSFTQAMAVVTTELEGPLSDEFRKVLRDNSYGKPLEEALKEMSDRTDDEDLDMFITALIIQRQVGGNLANILDTISHTIRERVQIKGEVKSLTAQGRMSGIVVSVLPIALALGLSVISPGYLDSLFTTTIGKIMIFGGVFLELIGIIVLTKLVDVKV
ncbi:tight adherence protein B [Alkalibaculum bacchi]|uniref:Tight adherence protein B n=1 Tax=Alkalibaculum bacchi TaxID=645887 RepID=A0A366I8Z4_9FIRM|nr:type II secretion system F family protein [Alkalibaculum bacchi]RBP65996.1 tight adherence protein B [Alkalibaculum bacchi]